LGGSSEVFDVQIISRVFPQGIEIHTPLGVFSTKRVPDLPTEEILILNHSEDQVARLGLEPTIFSRVYNIVITGGGFYQFCRDGNSGRTWNCKGEERLLCLSERSWRKFSISEGAEEIAVFSKAWCASDYKVRVSNDTDWKLVTCIVIALNESENVGSFTPI
jgi:hypothetical protein